MAECLKNLLIICNSLGVLYDEKYMNSLETDFHRMCYLFECILKYLGGK